jgi:glycogen(starch) synthase
VIQILHVLDHSLPEQSGYSFRSHAILRELMRRGVPLTALTGPKQGPRPREREEIDGVEYRRSAQLDAAEVAGVLGQLRTIMLTRRALRRILRAEPVSLIHAHSPCLNGLAALALGRPVLYELRSSWEDAAVSVGTTTEGSLRYRLSRWLETFVARRADAVVVICEGLERDLIERGIAASKITVVPNALPAEMLECASAEQGAAIRAAYGLADARVIGFFGSFFEWEGVTDLVAALPRVLEREPRARLLLAGGGRQEAELRQLVTQRELTDKVVFAGRIAHADVKAFYAAADVMAYPRIAHRLTELVTPLKPLEAMAQGRPVVASDVGGHRELIEHGKTGYLHRAGDVEALAATLVEVLSGSAALAETTAAARAYVERERRWPVVAERYLPVYEQLAQGARVEVARKPVSGA